MSSEDPFGAGTLIPEDGPSASNHLQLSVLNLTSTNTADKQEREVFSPDGRVPRPRATTVGTTPSQMPPKIRTPVVASTMEGPGSGDRLVASTPVANMSNYLSCTLEYSLDETDLVHQADEQVEPKLHSVSHTIPQSAEETISPIIEDPSTLPIEESTHPIAGNGITPADEVPNPLSSRDTPHQRVEELTPSAIKGPATQTDEPPNPSTIEKQDPVFTESTTLLTSVLTQDSQSSLHLHVADTLVDISNSVCISGTPGNIQHTTSSTVHQEQDDNEQDEIMVDALLAMSPDLNTPFNPLRGTAKLNNIPQEKGGGFVRVSIPETITPRPTETTHDLAPDPRNLSTYTPRPFQPDPHPLQETTTQGPSRRPWDANVTTTVPLSNVFTVQESPTHLHGSSSVLEGHSPRGGTSVTGLGSRTLRFLQTYKSPTLRRSYWIDGC